MTTPVGAMANSASIQSRLLIGAVGFLLYLAAAELGMAFALPDAAVTLIAPATGVALALVYRFGFGMALAVFAAAATFHFFHGLPFLAALVVASGNTGAAVLGAWLLRRVFPIDPGLSRVRDVLLFLLVGGVLSTTLSSGIGALVMAGAGEWQWQGFSELWWICWVADLMGVLIIAPCLFPVAALRRPLASPGGIAAKAGAGGEHGVTVPGRLAHALLRTAHWFELGLIALALLLVGLVVYGELIMTELTLPLSYAMFPLVIWAAVRFSVREVRYLIVLAAVIAVPFTVAGSGPFATPDVQAGLLSMHAHLGLFALTGLLLSATTLERQAAAGALLESEAKYRLLVEHQSELVLKLDPDGHILFASPSYRRFFGQAETPQQAGHADSPSAGSPERLLLPVRDGDPGLDPATLAGLEQPPHALYLQHRVRVGEEWRWLAWACRGVFCEDAGLNSVICVGRDVTRHVEAESRARRHLQELGRVGRISAMGEMAGGLAHELNQPLCAIMSFSQASRRLLDKPGNEADLRKALDRVIVNADRAGNIIRQMRAFVRNDEAEFQASDINALIREVMELTSGDASRHRVRLKLDEAGGLPPLRVSPIQIQQVLVNLIRNAVEAMEEMPVAVGARQIRLCSRLSADARWVDIVVADTGPGIPPGRHQSLFEPFVTRRVGGTGLGLSISRSIVEAHGGQIVLEDNGDVPGACFRVSLPIAQTGVTAHAV